MNDDADLKKYATPDKQKKKQALAENERIGNIPNYNFEDTGRFQDAIDYLSTQICSIDHTEKNEKVTKQISFQQRTEDKTMWFSIETWYAVTTPNADLIFRSGSNMTVIRKNDEAHHRVSSILSMAIKSLKNSKKIQSLTERIEQFRATIGSSLREKPLTGKHAKKLTQNLLQIDHICLMEGHGKLEQEKHDKNTFNLCELKVKYPHPDHQSGFFRTLFGKQHIDLRPTLVKSPNEKTFENLEQFKIIDQETQRPHWTKRWCKYILCQKIDPDLTHQNWWSHSKIRHKLGTCDIKETRAQIKNKPFWNLVGMILLGALCILAAQYWLKIGILHMLLTKPGMIISGLYCSGIIYFTIQAIQESHFACACLPKDELSTHAKHYVESKELKQKTKSGEQKNSNPGKINELGLEIESDDESDSKPNDEPNDNNDNNDNKGKMCIVM